MVKIVQENHVIGFWKGKPGKERNFIPLANFGLKLLKHVRAPRDLPQYSGFLVQVSQRQRFRGSGTSSIITGESFLPWYKVLNCEQLLQHLSPALPSGILSCQLSIAQTKSYLMELCQEFFEDVDSDGDDNSEQPSQYDPVTCTGLQPGSNVFVFGPKFQLFADGSVVPLNMQRFLWVETILQKLQRVVNPIERPISCLPHLSILVHGMHTISGDNVFSGVYLLGAGIISMHYEAIMARCGSVGIAAATSSISRGKTNCAKAAIAMCGNHPKGCTGYLTESMARGHLSGALPFLYDDPSSDSVLKPLLMHSFGGVEMGTRRAQFSARCSPIVTCNEFVIDSLSKADDRYLARVVLIPFVYDAPPIRVDTLDSILRHAHRALPEAVAIGNWLRSLPEDELYQMVEMVQQATGRCLDGRLAVQYALYTLCAKEIATRADYSEVTSDGIWEHFTQAIAPAILKWQVEDVCTEKAGSSDLGKLLKQGLEKALNSNKDMSEFLGCVAPNVNYHFSDGQTRTRVRGIAIRLHGFLGFLDKHGIPHRSQKAIRKRVKRNKRCASRMKQYFLKEGVTVTNRRVTRNLGQSTCKGCLCIPVDMVGEGFTAAFKQGKDVNSSITSMSPTMEESTEGSATTATNESRRSLDDSGIDINSSITSMMSPTMEESTEGVETPVSTRVSTESESRPWFFYADLSDNEFYNRLGDYYISQDEEVQQQENKKKKAKKTSKKSHKTRKTYTTLPKKWSCKPEVTKKEFKQVTGEIGLMTPTRKYRASPRKLEAVYIRAGVTPPRADPIQLRKLPTSPRLFKLYNKIGISPYRRRSLRKKLRPLNISPVRSTTCISRRKQRAEFHIQIKTDNSKYLTALKTRKTKASSRKAASAIDTNQCFGCKQAFIEGEEKKWVGCDGCVRWWHWACTGRKRRPNPKIHWLCPSCKK